MTVFIVRKIYSNFIDFNNLEAPEMKKTKTPSLGHLQKEKIKEPKNVIHEANESSSSNSSRHIDEEIALEPLDPHHYKNVSEPIDKITINGKTKNFSKDLKEELKDINLFANPPKQTSQHKPKHSGVSQKSNLTKSDHVRDDSEEIQHHQITVAKYDV